MKVLILSQQKRNLALGEPAIDIATPPGGLEISEMPFIQNELNVKTINDMCQEAQRLLVLVEDDKLSTAEVLKALKALQELDQEAVTLRNCPTWMFQTIQVNNHLPLHHLSHITDTVQLHSSIWLIYEWNYHRTARIIFLTRLANCAMATMKKTLHRNPQIQEVERIHGSSILHIERLCDEVLATVPQSLGDIDESGTVLAAQEDGLTIRTIGSYLLLWSIRVMRSDAFASTADQKRRADVVFERIRLYTGMKELLGDKSILGRTQI